MKKTYLEVLLEEIRCKFDLVLEGHEALHAKIDDVRREANEKHELTKFLLTTIAPDLAGHRAGIDAHSRYQVHE